MFNPAPRIGITAIDARNVAVVLDDVLLDPEALVARAVEYAGAFSAPPHNAYPGLELPLPDSVTAQLDACFAQHARGLVGARRTVRCHSRLSITACPPGDLQPRQWLPHVDRLEAAAGQCIAASVLYLFRDPALGGTSFYRMVVYSGTVFHAGEIRAPDRLVADPAAGRLTLNGFFLCRAALAAMSR